MVCLDLKRGEMTFDRSNGDRWSQGCSRSPLNLKGKRELDIHILADQSSIEVFAGSTRQITPAMCLRVQRRMGIG